MNPTAGATTSHRPFLLEIGSEEIPARFIPTALAELAARFAALLDELHLAHAPVRTVATPRRLTAICDQVALRQPDRDEEVKGPPVSVAFDAKGQPTKAALGFARKVGVELDACGRDGDQRGEYLVARRTITGRDAAVVLGERLPELILGLPFRKVMRWGTGDIEYPRPLQWLVCLLGDDVVPFRVGTLMSGRTTRGHRTLVGDRSEPIATAADYAAVMTRLAVVPDPDERRRRIEAQAAEILAAHDAPALRRDDPELLEEVVFLCEHPTVFEGGFDPGFFALPDEVIVTALRAHQRYFAVEREGGALLPAFLAVRDGGTDHLDRVREGNERVLRARLADALFYWQFDQRRSPDEHMAALATVTWLEGFGSVLDKVRRTRTLVAQLWRDGLGDGGPLPADLERAAAISKFDLVTEMIRDGKEFTKLEGVIGARYAAQAGESPAVCRILERQYLPRSAGDELPGDRESSTLSVADRLDTLAGCWLAGFAPTGAKDPYALRRHGLAVLRILLSLQVRVDLEAMLAEAVAAYRGTAAETDAATARDALAEFLRVRLEGELAETLGADPAVVKAVLTVRRLDPTDLARWVRALDGFRDREDFQLLATGFKRCKNILEGDVLGPEAAVASLERWRREGGRGSAGEVFAELPEAAERALAQEIAGAVPDLLAQEEREAYIEVFQTLSGFGPAIDRFFDEVRVNVADEGLRAARHAFLREIHALFLHFADFSLVAPADE